MPIYFTPIVYLEKNVNPTKERMGKQSVEWGDLQQGKREGWGDLQTCACPDIRFSTSCKGEIRPDPFVVRQPYCLV